MGRRIGWGLIVVGGLIALGILLRAKVSGPSKPLNVVLIVVDTLRADHLGVYGYDRDTSPHIDALARESVLFKHAIAAAPWTTPSVASMMTSQYPSVLGIRKHPVSLPQRFPLLSEILKQHGYTTHGIISALMISGQLGFSRGFDVYDEEAVMGRGGISSPAVADKATAFLSQDHARPFFLFVYMFDPHYNYIGHPPDDYLSGYQGPVRSGMPIDELWATRHSLSKQDIQKVVALYDSEIRFTDRFIGSIVATLKANGLYDNTLLVVTADHGEEFMERGWIGHSVTVFQELIHVPLIIRRPSESPRAVATPVGLIDIMPTILRYLGLTPPDNVAGRILDLDDPGQIEVRPIFSETFNDKPKRPNPEEPLALRTVILNGRKLIHDATHDVTRLYDLATDPDEQHDLSDVAGDEFDRLHGLLQRWATYVDDQQVDTPSTKPNELFSPEQIKKLKSLGYL